MGEAFLHGVASDHRKSIRCFRYWLGIGFLCVVVPMYMAGHNLFASEIRSSNESHRPPPVFVPLQDDRLSSKSFNSSVYAIYQDSRGFLWIGTHIGLMVYDGYQVKQYSPNAQDKTTISDVNVSSIAEDQDGNLWIGSMDGGISVFNPRTDTFGHHRHDPENPNSLSSDDVWCLYRTPSGQMWIGTWGAGLNRYDSGSGKFVRYQSSISEPDSLSSNVVNAIFEDHAGILWVGTNNGLAQFNREKKQFVHYRNDPRDPGTLSDNNVTAIFEDSGYNLWIGTGDRGLNEFDRESGRFVRYQHRPDIPGTLSSNKITAILEDEDGSLLIGTIDAGLNRFDRHTGQFSHYRHDLSAPQSLMSDGVRALFKDRSGLIWVGLQDGGALKLKRNKQRFTFHPLPNGPDPLPPGEVVAALFEDDDGTLWIGTLFGGMIRYDPQSNRQRRYRHESENPMSLSSNTVTAIRKDRDGNLWVGTYAEGLNRFDPVKQRFTRYRHDTEDPNSLTSNAVSALIEDTSGNIWIGTRKRGLDLLPQGSGRFIHYRHDSNDPESLSSNAITALCAGASGHIWIGTKRSGLNRLNPETGTFRRYRHKAHDAGSLSSDRIVSLHQARDGLLWIGTNGGGLNRFDPASKRFVSYRQKDGLADETIRAILEDDYGVLWLKSWGGNITKFNPRTEVFTNFGEESGLHPEQSLIGAAHRSTRGRMYFGGPQGYYAFRPYYNTHVPDIQITDFKLFSESVTPQDERRLLQSTIIYTKAIELTYRDQVFSFDFAALDYTDPELNRYAYMLRGIDDDWVYAGTQRSALYANIPPGQYEFHVKGSNSDGIWNETGTSVAIFMAPPPWKTWWAYSLYALLVISLFMGYGRYRAHKRTIALQREQEEAYRTKLELEVTQRTQELVETNDQLTQEISERKRVEENLRLSEEKYRSIIETAREGYILIDANLAIIDVNDEFCKMLGYPRRELIGKSLDALGANEFRHYLKMNRGNLFKEGGFETKGKLSQKNGHVIPVLLHGSVLRRNTGQSGGNVVFVTDLSVGEMSLALAAEVQQSLLNTIEPRIEGLDLDGRSRPCEEVGGDYFDLIQTSDVTGTSLIAVVGDISGHGVEAALLMTAARSFLRMRVQQEGSLANIVTDLNRHIFDDVSRTYRFMTLFILALDDSQNNLEWIRAGHDPGLLYDPTNDDFLELAGKGIALGLDADYPYTAHTKNGFAKDQIIILTSDGISETRNTGGEMFGKERLCKVVRSASELPAQGIRERVFEAVNTFTKGTMPDDDRTLVVIKRT